MKSRTRLKLFSEPLQIALRAAIEGRFAVGELRIKNGRRIHNLVVKEWKAVDSVPAPAQQGPFAKYAVLYPMHSISQWDASVGRGQSVVRLLFDANQPNELKTKVFIDGEFKLTDELCLVGPGMATIKSGDELGIETDDGDLEGLSQRHSRTIRSPWWRSAVIGLFGGGSGGSECGKQISCHSPAVLIHVDPGVVEVPNLNNLPHATPTDAKLRRKKTSVLLRDIHRNNPKILLHGICGRIQDRQVREFLTGRDRLDAIFSFLDDEKATIAAGIIARECDAVHISIGTLIRRDEVGRILPQIDVRLFDPSKGGGCAACVPFAGEAAIRDAIHEFHRPNEAPSRNLPSQWDADGRIGSSISLNAMAASIAIQLFESYLDGLTRRSTWVRWLPPELPKNGNQFSPVFGELLQVPVDADRRCPFCW